MEPVQMEPVRAAASSAAGLTGQGSFAKRGARKGEYLCAAAGTGGVRETGGLRGAGAFAGRSLPSPALPGSSRRQTGSLWGDFPVLDWFGVLGLAQAPHRYLTGTSAPAERLG